MSHSQAVELLNRVAWVHRMDGWGLHKDPGETAAPQPGTGIRVSTDILVHAPSWGVYDVLIDETEPTERYVGIIDTTSNYVPPTGELPPAPTPPVTDLSRIEERLKNIETVLEFDAKTLNQLRDRQTNMEVMLDAHVASTEAFQKRVGDEWRWAKSLGKNLLRYGPWVLAGILGREVLTEK